MACRTVKPLVWMMVVAVAAIMVAQNGKVCLATFDMGETKDTMMNKAEEAKETGKSWANWAYAKISGKLSVNPQDMKQGAEDMMHKASSSDSGEFVSGKLHAVSHSTIPSKDDSDKFYEEAKHDVGAAYDSMKFKKVHED